MTGLHPADAAELDRLLHQAAGTDTSRVLRDIVGGTDIAADDAVVDTVAAHCSVDHAATLVFPAAVGDVSARLLSRGWKPSPVVPSVVVRNRLTRRHNVESHLLEVSIVRGSRPDAAGVEIFCMCPTAATERVADRERREYHERHTALVVNKPNEDLLDTLRCLFIAKLNMNPDGGGHNPHENQGAGGRSVLYFRHPTGSRLELTCDGDFTRVVTRHTDGS